MTARRHDAHVHITPVDGPRATNLPDYLADRDAIGVDMAAIVTPSTLGWNNDVSFDAAAVDPERFRVIARVDLLADDGVEATRAVLERGAVGLRVTLMGEPDISWLDDGRIDEAATLLASSGAVVEFHAAPEQLAAVGRFAERFPAARVLIDHMGRPDVASGVDGGSFRAFLELAASPNVHAKSANSSFFSRAGHPFTDLIPFYERTLDVFGAERLLWASDWPLCVRDAPFGASVDPLETILGGADNADGELIWRSNFERVLGVAR